MLPVCLVLRTGEHDVVVDVTHPLVSQCAAFTKPLPAPGGGANRLLQYSTASGALLGSMFTEDPAVLQLSAAMSVVHPLKLEASRARYEAEGLSSTDSYPVVGSLLAAIDDVVASLSLDEIHVIDDHLVTVADMY